jgi:hypothetical protein
MLSEFACIFPDTRPKDDMLFPVVQLFRQTVHLAPVENDLPDTLPPLAEALLAQGLLRFHCPAPLGKDRESFLSLVRELRQRPADYAGLTLTGFGASQTPESKNAIMSAVRQLRGSIAENNIEQERAAALWQARLVLKLGELIEQEEEEIRQSLRNIALREQSLLESLRDERSTAVTSLDRPAASRRSLLRLKAWQKLLAASSGPLLSNLFITADHDAFDAFMEKNNAESQQTLTLSLPARPSQAVSDTAAQRQHFRQAAAELISNLPISWEQTAWETLLEQHYPASEHGRCRLSLHLLPVAPQDVVAADQSCQSADRETVLGILEPA